MRATIRKLPEKSLYCYRYPVETKPVEGAVEAVPQLIAGLCGVTGLKLFEVAGQALNV